MNLRGVMNSILFSYNLFNITIDCKPLMEHFNIRISNFLSRQKNFFLPPNCHPVTIFSKSRLCNFNILLDQCDINFPPVESLKRDVVNNFYL